LFLNTALDARRSEATSRQLLLKAVLLRTQFSIILRVTKYMENLKENSCFERNPKTTITCIVLFLLLISLVGMELFLRILGETAGFDEMLTKKYIGSFKDLRLNNSFLTDSDGVFKANKNYNWANGKYGVGVKINSDGFRSIEFKTTVTQEKTILLLGDSFAWGGSAKPITDSFADLIAREGYLVFNAGIPGTDPGQYAYLARKYIPILKPNIVAVTLYLGNDITRPSTMRPNQNLYHVTDQLWLYGFDEKGKYLSPEESFRLHYYLDYSPDILKNKVKFLIMKSVIGKRAWLFLRSMRRQAEGNSGVTIVNLVKKSLLEIQDVSEKYHARFFLFIIPTRDHVKIKDRKSLGHSFAGLDPRMPDFLTADDYNELPDGHFNNSGHYKYSRFILRTIGNEDRRMIE
jgi:hypothetical protein